MMKTAFTTTQSIWVTRVSYTSQVAGKSMSVRQRHEYFRPKCGQPYDILMAFRKGNVISLTEKMIPELILRVLKNAPIVILVIRKLFLVATR